MTGDRAMEALATEPDLNSLLDLPDDLIKDRLIGFIRQSGVKFSSRAVFEEFGWRDGQTPSFAKFWRTKSGAVELSRDPLLWDLREPLLRDAALACCCVLLHRRVRQYAVRWIGGMETAAIPIVAGILAVNRACGGAPLNGFYLRKTRKRDGRRRLLEGPPPPSGERVLLVDDILNKGISKKPLIDYCVRNGLIASGLLVVVDTERQGAGLFAPVCPVESLFTRSDILGRRLRPVENSSGNVSKANHAVARKVDPMEDANRFTTGAMVSAVANRVSSSAEMTREDVELVRLARDTVVYAALSDGQLHPMIREDRRGSPGYSPFLGHYLSTRGVVFTRISKREFKDGKWFNRLRGCQAVGLLNPKPDAVADMTVKSALVSATCARRVKTGPAVFHKPIWPEEIGAISLFVYLVEQFLPTRAQTAEHLLAEGHDVQNWGLIAQGQGYRGVVCSDLSAVPDVPTQIAVACRKMQNSSGILPQAADKVTFIRMKGRWLWDPARPKAEYF
jgi:orotate phosphoribosyltransferase